MRADIHPKYNDVTVQCGCGETFKTRSTHVGDISIEVCSKCHSFYTGQQRIMDTAGRVDKFKQRYGLK